uniref:ALMS motif domain-containing protein n=1 Tax=Knipowitschia caucasica TaxID=637954 RepID=A0AAV2LJH6_KNICA
MQLTNSSLRQSTSHKNSAETVPAVPTIVSGQSDQRRTGEGYEQSLWDEEIPWYNICFNPRSSHEYLIVKSLLHYSETQPHLLPDRHVSPRTTCHPPQDLEEIHRRVLLGQLPSGRFYPQSRPRITSPKCRRSAPSPPERRESWEKARISQPPKKEQSRVSFLTPVKIGWLPIRKKVTMVGEQGRGSHPSTQQVKLKPPITPTVMNTTSSSAKSPEGEEQRSQGKANGGLRTAWKNQDPAINKQGPERHFPAVTGGDGPVSWQSLKRGWRLNRVLALPGSSPNTKPESEKAYVPKRPQRPSSCYGNVLENSVGVEEKKLQPLVRTLSLDSTQRNGLRSLDVMPANGGILELSKNGNRETAVPTLKLIKSPDPDQTPEDVLALNAAAIIANIKLQRKLSKKKTPSGKSENGSSPSPQDHCAVEDPAQDSAEDGNSETKARTAAFVPLSSDIQRSTPNMSLQEALLRSRPDLISRSKRRTEDLQRRVQQRRWTNSQSAQTGNTGKRNHLLKTRRQQPTSKWPTELQRRQEEEARREENLSNRQRADLFKKKLLDQVLQRGKD